MLVCRQIHSERNSVTIMRDGWRLRKMKTDRDTEKGGGYKGKTGEE